MRHFVFAGFSLTIRPQAERQRGTSQPYGPTLQADLSTMLHSLPQTPRHFVSAWTTLTHNQCSTLMHLLH